MWRCNDGEYDMPGRWFGMAWLVVAMLLAGCRHTPDEQQLREAITAAAQAAEDTDAAGFGHWLTADFDGNGGEFDARRLSGVLRVAHLRDERVSVMLGPVTVEARGERMVATFTATLGGGGRLLPERLGVYEVETAWRRDGSEWRCYTASWQRRL